VRSPGTLRNFFCGLQRASTAQCLLSALAIPTPPPKNYANSRYSLAPYEKRVIELLRNSKDKRARRLAKKRVRSPSTSTPFHSTDSLAGSPHSPIHKQIY
jgi:hypothetical protein